MANIVPSGIDATTGRMRPLTSSDTLTDASGSTVGSGAGSGVPTSSAWTKNTETLSATKTLTDSSETLQFLDPNGADRLVVFPSLTTSTPLFMIVNTEESTGSSRLIIQTSTGDVIASADPGEGVRAWTDGTSVFVHEFTTLKRERETSVQNLYPMAGSLTSDGFYAIVNGVPSGAGNSTLDKRTEHVITEAGTLDLITIYAATFNPNVFKLWKNGAADTTFGSFGGGAGTLVPSMSVAAGDEVAFEYDSGSGNPGNTSVNLYVTPTSGSLANYHWGGNGSLNDYFHVIGDPTGGMSSTLNYDTEIIILESCVASTLSWNSQSASATTDFQIFKNGTSTETVELTGAVGTVGSLTTPFVEGDTVAIKHTAGTDPNGCSVTLSVSEVSGHYYYLGGASSTGTTNYFETNELTGATLTTGAVPPSNTIYPLAGTFSKMSVYTSNAVADTFEVHKNGALSSSQTKTAVNQTTLTYPNTSFAQDDRIAVRDVNANDSGNVRIMLFFN